VQNGGQAINGTEGDDSLTGGPGQDTIGATAQRNAQRRAGNDTLDGGPGDDTYIVAPGDFITTLGRRHVLTDSNWDLSAGVYYLDVVENLTRPARPVYGIGNARTT